MDFSKNYKVKKTNRIKKYYFWSACVSSQLILEEQVMTNFILKLFIKFDVLLS